MKIYGASDDLVEIYGARLSTAAEWDGYAGRTDPTESEEVSCYDRPVTITVGDREQGAVVVVMEYSKGGVWQATIRQIEEEVLFPGHVTVCNNFIGERVGYSVEVEILVHDGLPVRVEVGDKRP